MQLPHAGVPHAGWRLLRREQGHVAVVGLVALQDVVAVSIARVEQVAVDCEPAAEATGRCDRVAGPGRDAARELELGVARRETLRPQVLPGRGVLREYGSAPPDIGSVLPPRLTSPITDPVMTVLPVASTLTPVTVSVKANGATLPIRFDQTWWTPSLSRRATKTSSPSALSVPPPRLMLVENVPANTTSSSGAIVTARPIAALNSRLHIAAPVSAFRFVRTALAALDAVPRSAASTTAAGAVDRDALEPRSR